MPSDRSHVQAIASSTLWQVASQVTMAALSIVTVKFVAMGLSKELAGTYNTAYGYLQLFGILADFGLYAVAVREVSRAEDKEKVLGALIVLRSIILTLSLGCALLFVWILPAWRGTALPLSVTIAALVPFFTLLAGILRTVFQVHYRMRLVFVAEVTQRILTVTLTGLFIWAGVRGTEDVRVLFAFLGIGGVGALVLFLLSLTFASGIQRIRVRTDRAEVKRLLVLAVPYGIAFLCTALYRQFDVTMIALLRPDFELQNAYYGFVQRMMDMAYLLPTFLLNSTLPLLAARDAKGEDTRGLLGKTFAALLFLGAVSSLFSALWARPLTHLLTTEQYLSTAGHPGSDTALQLLSLSMFANGFIVFSFYALLTKHVWRPLVATLAFGVIDSLVLNAWLVPHLGFVGASLTSIAVHVSLACLLLPQALRALPLRLPPGILWRWLVFSGALGGALWVAHPLLTSDLRTAVGVVGMGGFLLLLVWMLGVDGLFRGDGVGNV